MLWAELPMAVSVGVKNIAKVQDKEYLIDEEKTAWDKILLYVSLSHNVYIYRN
jgi:hypothetical protein